MALTKCKECGKEVSANAKSCPHCGVSHPGATAKDFIVGLMILAVIVWGLMHWIDGGNGDVEKPKPERPTESATPEQTKQTEAERAAAIEACRRDIQCWGDKHSVTASIDCAGYVEKLAKYTHEWTDGILEPKFSRFRWKDMNKGYVTYIGDKIKFQNGFGAWQDYVYECDLDPENNRVLDVRARPGRF